jgi:putative aldouronate transport system permease protein
MRWSIGQKIFNVFNIFLLSLIALITLYPLIYVVSASLSPSELVVNGTVWFLPKEITWGSYAITFRDNRIWTAYANTLFYTFAGGGASLFTTVFAAYSLSKKRLIGNKIITLMIVFTMWFNAGIIPTFLNFQELGLLDSRFGFIAGFLMGAFNLILMRTYFESVPESLEESAKLDGANDLIILFRIYIPLALPAIATIGLFYAVEKWNGYFWAMLLFRDEHKVPLQVLLKKLIVETGIVISESANAGVDASAANISKETVVYSTIVISVLPMMVFYPFIQRYFVKGIMIGAVKG